jgi:hypothetical protein
MAYFTNPKAYISQENLKKFPFICDPNKLRNTSLMPITKTGSTKSSRVILDKVIQQENLSVFQDFVNKIKAGYRDALFDVRRSPLAEISTNENSNYTRINYQLIIDFLSKYQPEKVKTQPEILALVDYVKANSVSLAEWSVVIVNRGDVNNRLDEVKIDCFVGNKLRTNEGVKMVRRDRSAKIEYTNSGASVLYFKSILDQNKDNIFDVLNENNYDEYNEASSAKKASLIKEYRNEQGKPILMIYFASSSSAPDIPVIPLFYCFIPYIKGATKVQYVVRNRN